MKNKLVLKTLTFISLGLLLPVIMQAQTDKSKRPSPPAMASGQVGGAKISIDYSSPSVKGRKIFGGLLPYGEVWRAGANEATIFQTDKDLLVEGHKLPAGKYSFFATPGKDEWTIFFNSEVGQWGDKPGGAANMDPTKTVLKFDVKAEALPDLSERLEYKVTTNGFFLQWENTKVVVNVK